MERNVGGIDRDLRLLGGGLFLGIGLFGGLSGTWRILALGLAASELTTAFTRKCPLNKALGVNTATDPEAIGDQVERAVDSATEHAQSLAE